ncbi:MAG: ATP-binding cassette domain-containing protein [Candidatus Dadabacteria bacterium]|nr:ATP-binding cassette domain-containing protein [Candidatus Dadabacteria bacterium]
MIEVTDLWKVYETNGSRVEALRGVDLRVDRGRTLVIEGVSGSGKSTLLHLMGGLDHPTKGNIKYDGEDLLDKSDRELAEFRNNKIGFVFQFHYLLSEFDALENVMMPALINGMGKKEASDLALKVLEDVGLGSRATHRPGELSGGEQQRVAIARAMVLKPEVIFADEPTGNLDQKTGSSIIDLFVNLNKEYNVSIIVVTHNSYVSSYFDSKINLLDGQIVNEN